jgi:hypothetical protein
MRTLKPRTSVFFLPGIAFALLVLASCGPRTIAYGVILWGEPSGPASAGAVVSIIEKSESAKSLIFTVSGGNPMQFPEGHVRSFASRADALKFTEGYSPYLTSWALCQKLDAPPLPIRDVPNTDGRSVYRLRPNQLMKIIGRSAERETIRPYTDYWYEVVTEDGYSGWCYGHFLRVFTVQGDPSELAKKLVNQDETLDIILGSTWRPDWFAGMIQTGEIDLTRFREDVGLFPMPSESLFKLVMPLYSVDFRYTSVDRIAMGQYLVGGTDLRISVLDKDRIQIGYKYKSQELGGVFVVIKEDVAEIIQRERERRQELFESMRAGGSTFTSTAYGTIQLLDQMRFAWTGFEKLTPTVIGQGARGAGTVDFPYHLSQDLRDAYDGVITLFFDGLPAASGQAKPLSGQGAGTSGGVSFLYKAVDGGLRFTSLSKESFSELTVKKVGFSPVIIFFTQGP